MVKRHLLGLVFAGLGILALQSHGQQREARWELSQAMEGNAQLYRACLSNIKNQFTPGYRAYEIWGVEESPAGRQLRTRFSQGSLRKTDNPYDIAIDGGGFFLLSNGLLTRAGCFRWEAKTGHLVTESNGPALMGESDNGSSLPQPIVVPLDVTGLTVEGDGQVQWVRLNGDGKPESGGRLILVDLPNPASGLERVGPYFRVGAGAGPVRTESPGHNGMGIVTQGYLEMSNVNLYQQWQQAEALRRYAGLSGFPVTGDLWESLPLQSPTVPSPAPDRLFFHQGQTFELSEPAVQRLGRLSAKTGRPVAELAREAIDRYCSERNQ